MGLSNSQFDAIKQIENIEKHFGVRWFIQSELAGITLHTMKALVQKGYLEEQYFEDMPYYRYKGRIGEQIKSQSSSAEISGNNHPITENANTDKITSERKLSTHDTLQSPSDHSAGNFFQNRKPYHTPKSEIPIPADDTHQEEK